MERDLCNVLGIDLSSRAIDLVLLAESSDHAEWTHVELDGATAFERAREVAGRMPQRGWYESRGVYLVAIERPFSSSRNDVVRLVQGCVLASLPRQIATWECAPQTWKGHIAFKGRGKPGVEDFPSAFSLIADEWPQDAFDALGVALWARDTNADLVTSALLDRGAA